MKNNYTEWIDDINKIFYFLLDIANAEENKYRLKEFGTHSLGSIGGVAGDRISGMFEGSIWVIAKKDILDNISNDKMFYGAEFSYIADKIVKDGNSMVIITNNYYENHALPRDVNENVDVHNFWVRQFALNELRCYTYDDELGKAVNMLDAYIKKYGGNLEDITVSKMIYNAEKIEKAKVKSKKLK